MRNIEIARMHDPGNEIRGGSSSAAIDFELVVRSMEPMRACQDRESGLADVWIKSVILSRHVFASLA